MNIFSLFDGISCGQIALEKAGVKCQNYYASEIDKHAIAVTQHNYPNTKQLGDIYNIDKLHLPRIDLLLGGSPCKSFSSVGKKKGFDDEQGQLFYEFVRIKNDTKPKWFLFENVPMTKDNETKMTRLLGVEPIMINSALVSAQNRKRLYWTNIKFDTIADKNIGLKNVIDLSLQLSAPKNFEKRIPANPNIFIDPYNKKNIVGNKSSTLRTNVNNGNMWIQNKDKKTYRNLTVGETELLQTIPLNYTNVVPNNIAKKLISNAWTIDVIAHILRGIK